MEKVIKVGNKDMRAVCNALIPRKYRRIFNRDFLIDLKNLVSSYNEKIKKDIDLPIEILEIFENVSWLFFKEGGEEVGDNPDEWLESLEMLSIYEILPQIVELWGESNMTTSIPSR